MVKQKPEWVKAVLETRDRRQAAMTISPNGLYLVEVGYPEKYGFPKTPIGPMFVK